MRSRSTITAALALAAATILAVAACGSSVTGSAQPNTAVAQTMETSAPGELTDATAIPTDLSELTSMLGELPSDVSVPSELNDLTNLSLPSDLTFPSDLSDLTGLEIPGYNSECLSVASAYASISLALLPVLFGGTEQFDAGELQASLNSLSGSVPAELQGDIQTLSDLAAQASGKTLTEAAEILDSSEYTAASDNIDAWITANCGG